MIDKEELLNNKEFYKSFKSGEDLASFFKQMQKSAVEHMLNAELDAHLDNEKHEKTKDGNYCKGHGTKKIKSPRCAKSLTLSQLIHHNYYISKIYLFLFYHCSKLQTLRNPPIPPLRKVS